MSETPDATVPPLLVNALPRREVYVLVDGKPRKLPRVNPPTFVDDARNVGAVTVAVQGKPGKKLQTVSLVIQGKTPESHPFIIEDLPRLDGVLYLVEPEMIALFPERTDFVMPATYTMWYPQKFEKALNGKKRRKARRKVLKSFDHEKRFPLSAVQYGPLITATADTSVLILD